jgi:hypothetical protein
MSSYIETVAGAGTIAAAIGILYAIIKCCERKKFKSASGCINFELEADLNSVSTQPPPPSQTPKPSPNPSPVIVGDSGKTRSAVPSFDLTKV